MAIEVQGAEQFARLAKELRATGDKRLQRDLNGGLNRAAKPLIAQIRQSATATIPTRGGLAAGIAKSRINVQRRASSRAAGVRIVAKNRYSLYHLDQGQIRHRRKDGGVTVQKIEPGFFTKPTTEVEERVRREMLSVLNNVSARLDRAVKRA